jgi:competence protein ComEA
MKSLDRKTWLSVLFGVVAGLLLGGMIFLFIHPPTQTGMILLPTRVPKTITVYLTGEILNPGVYTLPIGTRIDDAIQSAGGFTANADQQAVNLAAVLEDEDRILVPEKGSTPGISPVGKNGPLLNINTASVKELEDLPAIGTVKAQAIVQYRNQQGPFLSIEDIMNVPGIGESIFVQFKDLVTVNP